MKRLFCTIAIVLAAAFCASAQDTLEPGIYALVDGSCTSLSYANGITANSSTNVLGIEIGKRKESYKGETSGVRCSGTLVMVINPEKKIITKTLKKYDPFIKTMNPDLIMIVPLEVQKNKRVYDEGRSLMGINTEQKERVSFEWEQTDENTFEIRFQAAPGEYAVVFKPTKIGDYDLQSIYGFYVAEQVD